MRNQITLLFISCLLALGLEGQSPIWTGASPSNNDWHNAQNWANGAIPTASDDVTIEADANSIYITADTMIEAKSITLMSLTTEIVELKCVGITLDGGLDVDESSYILPNINAIPALDHVPVIFMDDCQISLDNDDANRIKLIVEESAEVEQSADITQKECILEIKSGSFKTESYGLELYSIVIEPDSQLSKQSFYGEASEIILNADGEALQGLHYLDSDSIQYFENVDLTFMADASQNIPHQLHINFAGFHFNELHFEKPANISGNPTVKDLELTDGYSYFISGDITIDSIITQYFKHGVPSCSRPTLLAGDRASVKSDFQYNGNNISLHQMIIRNVAFNSNNNSIISLQESVTDNVTGFDVSSNNYNAKEYRWLGGSNNNIWQDGTNWQVKTAGGGGIFDTNNDGCVPTPLDNVKFNLTPGGPSPMSNTINIPMGSIAFCNDFYAWGDSKQLEANLDGHLIVNGDFRLAPNNNFNSSLTISNNSGEGEVVMTSSTDVQIVTSNKDLPFILVVDQTIADTSKQVELLGKLDVNGLEIINGKFTASKRKIITPYLHMTNGESDKVLDLEDCLLIIDGNALYEEFSDHKSFDYANLDIEPQKSFARFRGRSKIHLQGDSMIFNGGNNEFPFIKAFGDVHFMGGARIGSLELENEKQYSIQVDEHIAITESLMVVDTSTNVYTLTHLKSVDYRPLSDNGIGFAPPSSEYSTIHYYSDIDICLQDIDIRDIKVVIDGGVSSQAFCDTSLLSFPNSGANLDYITSGWLDRSTPCYSFIEGKALKADSTGIGPGMVSCFKYQSSLGVNQVMFDTIGIAMLDSNGSYIFTNLNTGIYIIKVDPFNNLVPHYYPNKKLWSTADKINVQGNQYDKDVILSPMAPPSSSQYANKVIQGTLSPDTGGNAPTPLFNLERAFLREGIDIEDSLVIGLYSLNEYDVVQTVMCDTNGYFRFENVDTGEYEIHPDIAGIPVAGTGVQGLNSISVNTNSDSIKIDFKVSTDSIYPVNSILTNLSEDVNTKVTVWPNPVAQTLNIQFNEYLERIQLMDIMARQINIPFSQNGQLIKADISHVPSGFYILMLDDKRVSTPIIKQ